MENGNGLTETEGHEVILAVPADDDRSRWGVGRALAKAGLWDAGEDIVVLADGWMNWRIGCELAVEGLKGGHKAYSVQNGLAREIGDDTRDGLLALAEGSLLGMDGATDEGLAPYVDKVVGTVETLGVEKAATLHRFYLQADYL